MYDCEFVTQIYTMERLPYRKSNRKIYTIRVPNGNKWVDFKRYQLDKKI